MTMTSNKRRVTIYLDVRLDKCLSYMKYKTEASRSTLINEAVYNFVKLIDSNIFKEINAHINKSFVELDELLKKLRC